MQVQNIDICHPLYKVAIKKSYNATRITENKCSNYLSKLVQWFFASKSDESESKHCSLKEYVQDILKTISINI